MGVADLCKSFDGEIVIVPPAGAESSFRETKLIVQLGNWAERDGRGEVFNPSVVPDAAWVSNARLARLSKKERRRFLRLVPEFVVEVMSPSDRLRAAKRKMEEWIANGVELGWLIHADLKTVFSYRQYAEMEKLEGLSKLAGEGPVTGFVLDLKRIWQGL